MIEKIIDDLYNIDATTSLRSHLGASVVGNKCSRAIWYAYNKASENPQPKKLFRLFKTGSIIENRLVTDLIALGYTITDTQTAFRYKDSNFGGSIDGIITIDNERHILEIKTHNHKSFSDLLKNKVEKSKLQHYTQMQVYMHLSSLKKALYLSVNKNTDEIYAEIIEYDQHLAETTCEKAAMIIAVDTPPARIAPDRFGASWYECRICNFSHTCYEQL